MHDAATQASRARIVTWHGRKSPHGKTVWSTPSSSHLAYHRYMRVKTHHDVIDVGGKKRPSRSVLHRYRKKVWSMSSPVY